eukprot:135036_1
MNHALTLLLYITLCSSQKTTLWTIREERHDPSELLRTINATFYPNIDIQYALNLREIISNCSIGCNVLYPIHKDKQKNYPNELNPISLTDYNEIINKSINIYIEYPECIQISSTKCEKFFSNDTIKGKYERAVVVSPKLSPLEIFDIIDLHQVTWIDITRIAPILSKHDWLYMAHVAGFDVAIYEFTNIIAYPLLYTTSEEMGNIQISLTSLSDYSLSRYVPFKSTKIIITLIINKLMNSTLDSSQIAWINHYILPTIVASQTVNIRNIKDSFQRGINWIFDSKLLANEEIIINNSYLSRETPSPTASIGDGSMGLLEGFLSLSNRTGGQSQSIVIRTDCNGEISAGLAWNGYLFNDINSNKITYNLLNYLFNTSGAQQTNKSLSDYGLLMWQINWNEKEHNPNWYCDDNARGILGTMIATSLLHISTGGNDNMYSADKFVENIVKGILGNFRLISIKGFVYSSANLDTINNKTWKYYWNGEYERDDPHYVSWIWCLFLFTYHITGYEPMYERSLIGIENMMDAFYNNKLHWANGLTQEYSRLLLPLVFLNKVEHKSNQGHIKWLKDVGKILNIYEINGTIIEHYGNLSYGGAKPAQSNVEYGTHEAPLEQENGDPVSDALYSLPFAQWGLHEAYLLTNDYELFGKPLQYLTDYLINIQVFVDSKNIQYSYLNGSWFRAFDFNNYEYFASGSDSGWGPYSVESGWTIGEILNAYGLIMTNNSFFDIVNRENLHRFDHYVEEYIPIFDLPPA